MLLALPPSLRAANVSDDKVQLFFFFSSQPFISSTVIEIKNLAKLPSAVATTSDALILRTLQEKLSVWLNILYCSIVIAAHWYQK